MGLVRQVLHRDWAAAMPYYWQAYGLVALGEAELAAGQPQRAVELLGRAARLARETGLLRWRIEDAERSLGEAEAALASTQS
jgi:hypothetical protein